jgi:hypothetical protein
MLCEPENQMNPLLVCENLLQGYHIFAESHLPQEFYLPLDTLSDVCLLLSLPLIHGLRRGSRKFESLHSLEAEYFRFLPAVAIFDEDLKLRAFLLFDYRC